MKSNLYHQFVEENLIISITDSAGTITYVNDRFCEISQYNREELLGKNHRIIKSGYHRSSFYASMWRTVLNGKTWMGEVCNRAKDGSIFWVETFIMPQFSFGKPVKFYSFRIPITDRKREEEKLRISENKLKAIFENSSGYYIFIKADYTILSFNKGSTHIAERITGKKILEGVSILEYSPEKVLLNFKKHFQAALEGNEVKVEEHVPFAGDGVKRWFQITYSPVYDHTNKLLGVSFNAEDIEKRKRAEQSVKKSELMFRALLENNDDAIVLIDKEGCLSYQSPAAGRILGYRADETIGMSGAAFYHPDDIPVFLKHYNEAMQNPGVPIFYPSRLKHKNGHYVWAEGTITNLFDDENINALVGNFRDITKRKEAEDKLIRQNERLSEIAHIQSHEIRGPVATLLGLISLFNQDNPSDPINQEVLAKIVIATSKLDEVIHKVVEKTDEIDNDR